jgi:hypothetical protein
MQSSPFTEAELTQYVISQLGKHVARNDLIFKLTHATGMSWNQAESFVSEVENQNKRQIALRQSPLLLILGGGIVLGGIVATFISVSYFIALFHAEPFDIVTLRRSYRMLLLLATGVGMILGGSYGLWRAVTAIWIE